MKTVYIDVPPGGEGAHKTSGEGFQGAECHNILERFTNVIGGAITNREPVPEGGCATDKVAEAVQN